MVKQLISVIFALLLVCNVAVTHSDAQQNPDYEKFGRIATLVVKEDYPGEEVVDYKYMGRQDTADNKVVDSFQFQVKKDGRPQAVLVKVTHDLKNDKEFTLTLEEQKQQ